MNTEENGSFLREPSVSERELKSRIEALITEVPLNANTVVERNLTIGSEISDINTIRAKKELEASLGHQVGERISVTMRYNPNWQTFDVSQLRFALPGTSSLTAHADFDPESDSYSSYLYDSDNKQQIARKPIQTSTVKTLVENDGFISNVTATTHGQLLAELFLAAPTDMELTIRQSAVLIEEALSDDVYGICTIERTQTYSEDDILDVIEFANQVCMTDSKHARIVKVITSQHGSTITGEETDYDEIAEKTTLRHIDFDYEMLEKLLSHVDKAQAALRQQP